MHYCVLNWFPCFLIAMVISDADCVNTNKEINSPSCLTSGAPAGNVGTSGAAPSSGTAAQNAGTGAHRSLKRRWMDAYNSEERSNSPSSMGSAVANAGSSGASSPLGSHAAALNARTSEATPTFKVPGPPSEYVVLNRARKRQSPLRLPSEAPAGNAATRGVPSSSESGGFITLRLTGPPIKKLTKPLPSPLGSGVASDCGMSGPPPDERARQTQAPLTSGSHAAALNAATIGISNTEEIRTQEAIEGLLLLRSDEHRSSATPNFKVPGPPSEYVVLNRARKRQSAQTAGHGGAMAGVSTQDP